MHMPRFATRADRIVRRVVTLGIALLGMALVGCASLPAPAPRTQSSALEADESTPLGHLAATSAAAEAGQSGLRLLADGDHALNARLALIRRAERSLDLQYYLIASDDVGLQVFRELRDAAARGVRVRLLIDDLYTAGQDALLAGLAAHPNVEVRLFNPLPVRGDSFGTRLALSLHQFQRINHRMHNKLFVADNAFAVAGGRNLANEYFMRSPSANFIDMDVLVSGPAVRELSGVFDSYWNSEQAWPVQRLVKSHDATAARAAFDEQVRPAPADGPVTSRDRFGRPSVQAQLDAGRLDLDFAPVRLLVDDPAKAAGTVNPDTTTMSQALGAMRSAQDDLLIVSPYFVPGPHGMALLQHAVDKQVQLTVMTNSLGATDEPVVHAGYSRYRKALLKMGVKLLELGSTLSRNSGALGDFGSSLGRLHAKLTVIDKRQVLIGSMNMDGRSTHFNTEMALLIDSPAVAANLVSMLDGGKQASTYRLRLAEDDQQIEWLSTENDREVVSKAEPDSTLGVRLKTSFTSLFLSEEML